MDEFKIPVTAEVLAKRELAGDTWHNLERAVLEKLEKDAEDKYVEAGGKLPATRVMSRAIKEVEEDGYKVMVALLDCRKDVAKEDRIHTFCDIENKKLREVIYKEIENDF